MSKVEKNKIEYMGFDKPTTLDQIYLEILGLENVKALADLRISQLKQSVAIKQMESADESAVEQKEDSK